MKNITAYLVLLLITLIVGCKEEPKNYEELSDDTVNSILTLQKGIRGRQNLTIFPHDGMRTTEIRVNYGGIGLPASTINIQLEVDDEAIDSINNLRISSGQEPYLTFPAGSYSLDKSTIAIQAGTFSSEAAILSYDSDQFDLDKQYIIVFKAGNTSGYKFAENKTKVEFLAAVIEKEQPKTGWIASASSEHPGEATGLPAALIDGNLGTFWHSNYNAPAAPYPHEATVLFKKDVYVTKVALYKRQAAGQTTWFKVFDLYGTTDGTTWHILGADLTTLQADLEAQFYVITPQYLQGIKLVMKSGHTNANTTHLAEISPYGY